MEKQSLLLLPWPRVAWVAQGQEDSHHSLPLSCSMALSCCTKAPLSPDSNSSWRGCLDMLLMAPLLCLLSWICRDKHLGRQTDTLLWHYKSIATSTQEHPVHPVPKEEEAASPSPKPLPHTLGRFALCLTRTFFLPANVGASQRDQRESQA